MRAPAILLPWLLLSACRFPLHAQEPGARDSACEQAIQAFQAAPDSAEARSRLRQACYPVTDRAPALREPITVEGALRAPSALPSPAVPPPISLPKGPTALTQCDAGGCWDNQGIRYNGTGTILHGPGGVPCTRNGDWIECR